MTLPSPHVVYEKNFLNFQQHRDKGESFEGKLSKGTCNVNAHFSRIHVSVNLTLPFSRGLWVLC